jgi:hypothetical protein
VESGNISVESATVPAGSRLVQLLPNQ